MEKGKRNLLIFWAVVVVIIIIELIIGNRNGKRVDVETSTSGNNEIVNNQPQESNKQEEKPNEKTETKFNFTKNSIIIYVGASETLKLEGENINGLKWTSSHEKIATVSSSGSVTGTSIGTAIIKAEAADGTFATCNVVVAQQVANKPGADPDANNPNGADNNYNNPEPPISNDNPPINDEPDYYEPDNNWGDNIEPEIPDDITGDNNEENPEQVKYTITYMLDGEIYNMIEVEDGNLIPIASEKPVKDGYTFRGWYFNGTEATGDLIVNDNMTIVGQWDDYTFAVNPIYNDLKSPNRIVVAYKNGNIIGATKLCGQLNGNSEYTLGKESISFGTIKIVSYAQFLKASNYKLKLSTGELVFADVNV